jgi:beta-phosphoglucomutase-like phosphatase (HAD superfamily)
MAAAARLGVPPERCAAVEDLANGLRSAAAAGMWVVAVPNRRYPPPAELVQVADLVLTDLRELSSAAIEGLGSGR